jgi:hypothetical protein
MASPECATSGLPYGLKLPGSDLALEGELKERFDLLRSGQAGALVRLHEQLIQELDRITPPLQLPLTLRYVNLNGTSREVPGGLMATLQRDPQEYVLEVPALAMFASGETWADTQDDLFRQLQTLVDRFGSLGDTQMTSSGLALKAKLKSLGLLDPIRGPG